MRERYVEALKKEMLMRKDYLEGEYIKTIYLGGGTPSQLDAAQISSLLHYIYNVYAVSPDAEITVECNPDDVTPSFISELINSGVNRLSMGVQTFDDRRLAYINRRHSASGAIKAVEIAKKMGLKNISIDLIYGFPNEYLDTWRMDVETALNLNVTHISAYCLTIEEGTLLHKKLLSGDIEEVDEDLSLSMYELLMTRLAEAGYEHYEISNFARLGYRSRHNSCYWNGTHYLGLGAAAHSFDGKSRQWNPSSLELYIKGVESCALNVEREVLSLEMKYDEYIMTRLRTHEGFSLAEIRKNFGEEKEIYCIRQCQKYIDSGNLEFADNGERVRLSRKGIFISDDIMSDLMSDI